MTYALRDRRCTINLVRFASASPNYLASALKKSQCKCNANLITCVDVVEKSHHAYLPTVSLLTLISLFSF